jgi:hypothetical protein
MTLHSRIILSKTLFNGCKLIVMLGSLRDGCFAHSINKEAAGCNTCGNRCIAQLHTFDGSDLLSLDGQIPMADGRRLKICRPPMPPPPSALPPLLAIMDDADDGYVIENFALAYIRKFSDGEWGVF